MLVEWLYYEFRKTNEYVFSDSLTEVVVLKLLEKNLKVKNAWLSIPGLTEISDITDLVLYSSINMFFKVPT